MRTLHIWIVVTDILISASLIPFAMEHIGKFTLYRLLLLGIRFSVIRI